MTLQEEVREFCQMRMPDGAHYLAEVPVPAFNGHTWEDVFAGRAIASERMQHAVLNRLRDIFANCDPQFSR